MFVQYGPSWRLPLGVKQLDMPHYAKDHVDNAWTIDLVAKFKTLVNTTTRRIEANAVNRSMNSCQSLSRNNKCNLFWPSSTYSRAVWNAKVWRFYVLGEDNASIEETTNIITSTKY